MVKHKFNAKPTTVDNIRFASKKEAKRYHELKMLRDAKEILFFLRQVPFHLPGNVRYVCDFAIFWASGDVTFEDIKGFRTPMYKNKCKMVEELYAPVKITEV